MNVLALPARVGVLVVLVALAGCQSEPAPRSAATPAPDPPVRGYDGPLPALEIPPYVPNPAVVRAVYEFAARRPDVLHYVPCFCGCERNGHADNADCFVAGREADGRPRWELHGMGWAICIDVARDAMQMHRAGSPIADIRRAVEQKYAYRFPTMTPTPPPK